MHSASSFPSIDALPDPASCLVAALNDLLRAVEGRVVLLRPLAACFNSHRDDIDLLLTEAQCEQLLYAAFAHCVQGRIHCRIQQSSSAKAQLILWTIDCGHMLMIDLWTSFDQLPCRRHSCIPAGRLLGTLTTSVSDAQIQATEEIPALRRLPPDIDLCLLIQHLATKRRKVTTPAVRERIARACERLASWSPEQTSQDVPYDSLAELRVVAAELPRAILNTPRFIALSHDYLLQRLRRVPSNRGLPVLEPRRRRGQVTKFRRTVLKHRPTVAVIGSDGAGKTSVVSALALQQPNSACVVAKKFYRRALTYQFISGLMKRLSGTDRGMFDERAAVLVTLRATAALWIRIWMSVHPWSNKAMHFLILDRSIAGFLLTDRKSDTPRLTRGATWIEELIPPVTSVLLTLPHAELTRRKQEMSAHGHDAYQRMLFEQALRQQPTDLILLANLPSAQAAAAAICELLRGDRQSAESSTETVGNRKAVA
ncbi:MAG: hypothetical protein NTX48_18265 [Planctomycetales bacterium]|nr:hypothetical protein [Planctomycetales bacterium]